MEINKIGVVGAGQMGVGIAQVAAQCGISALVNDISGELIHKGLDRIKKSLDRQVAKEKIEASRAGEILERLHPAPELSGLSNCDFVVEAATERKELKLSLFEKLHRITRDQVILASNTSSISITEIAAVTGRPDRVIGMHFMNPVPVMKLCEIIRGLATSGETTRITEELATRMGKTLIRSQDRPGFIVNRVAMPMINEAAYALYEGVGTPEDIDTGLKLGLNHPMGPLQLADLVGLDTVLAIMEVLHAGLGDDKYRPCPLLRNYVAAGWLGQKTGRGFYHYRK